MSINWNIETLLSVLKHETVSILAVRVGDVIIGGHGPEHVARIDCDTPGHIGILDYYDSGVYHPIRYPGSKQDTTVEIICRDSIDLERSLELCDPS